MNEYEVRFINAAAEELQRLDAVVQRRVIRRLNWLKSNFGSITPEPLTGGLAGFFKLRAGDYRVIYEIMRDECVIMVHMVGHRRDVYRRQ